MTAAAAALVCGTVLYATKAPTADVKVALVSSWLMRDRQALVEIARAAKLATICHSMIATSDYDRLEATLRDRAQAKNAIDREYAAVAIREGETEALLDFKASPSITCGGLRFSEVNRATNYLSGRKTLP